ncbi:hypothetical protein GDO81_010380 [Engystomops pustulosus]|uniref:Sema domain-containing protein n=1 Tax=Engystomops pustulosus TaxID=76066 RepID=A0AAV7BZI3_ENGPU|nr:hypothetical protein GDO81_010380 [Engystomops pustulosus]
MSRITFSLFFIFMLMDPIYNEEPFHFKYPINNIAVGRKHVIIATENCLYQFTHILKEPKTTGPHGESDAACMGRGDDRKPTYYNKILLVYNDTVLACWNEEQGACRELDIDLKAVGKSVITHVVPQDPIHTARGLIFYTGRSIKLFIARFTNDTEPTKDIPTIILRLRDKDKFIINNKEASVSLQPNSLGLNYVDVFQWKNFFFFPYYPTVGSSARVVVLNEEPLVLAFHTQSNLICGSNPQRKIILSSFAIQSSEGFLWAGIFTTNSTASIDRTALCIYNFTGLEQQTDSCINEDFVFNRVDTCTNYSDLMPVTGRPALTHGDLTAVLVKEVDKRLVFFLGTGNGKLLKVTLNSNYTANCPEVLYTFTNEAPVFRTIQIDPIDNSYLYVATVKEIKRLKIANCEQHESCNDCLSANDPHCGWCPSESRCTMKTECKTSPALEKWIGTSEEHRKCLKIKVFPNNGKIEVRIEKNPLLFKENAPWSCEIIHKDTRKTLCSSAASSLNCSCWVFSQKAYETATFTAAARSKSKEISEQFQFQKCLQYAEFSCLDCISSGCLWCTSRSMCISPFHVSQCEKKDYADEGKCRLIEAKAMKESSSNVSITYVSDDRVSSAGKKRVSIRGRNLQSLPRLFLFGSSSCNPQILQVSHHNSTQALISLPPSQTEVKKLCVDYNRNCYHKSINYESVSCSAIVPNTLWLSGGRKLGISGRNLDLIDDITISKNMVVQNKHKCLGNSSHCHFIAPKLGETAQTFRVKLTIQESTVMCGEIIYKADPNFKTFYLLTDNGEEIELRIEKEEDELNIQAHEIDIKIHYQERELSCIVNNATTFLQNSIHCKARMGFKGKVNRKEIEIEVTLGNFKARLKENPSNAGSYFLIFLAVPPLLVIVVIAAYLITKRKSKEMSRKLAKDLEELECEIRKEIREGFAELQTEKEDVPVEVLGTIPFFDYKHFALNTFFPDVSFEFYINLWTLVLNTYRCVQCWVEAL